MDEIIKVLNHGFVRLVDVMGDDSSIVQAARVSYGKGTKTVSEDKALINYLLKNRHTSPFEMVEFKFHIKLPIFCMRQLIRHRTANINEVSARYSVLPDEFYIPELEQVCVQSKNNKQGRGDSIDEYEAKEFIEHIIKDNNNVYKDYSYDLEEVGIARELARINLPVSIYTECYWKCDLRNLFHLLGLRMDGHAQYEIRVYADAMAEFIKFHCPLAYDAFEEHMLYSETFSKSEMECLKTLAKLFLKDNAYNITQSCNLNEFNMNEKKYEVFLRKIGI